MPTQSPPSLQYVNGFKDEPAVKNMDSTVADEQRGEFEAYLRQVQFPLSMYLTGMNNLVDSNGVPSGDRFLGDTLRLQQLMLQNPVTLPESSQENKRWHYCYLYNPHISTKGDVNLIIFDKQSYSVTNTGVTNLYVYIRRYDTQGDQYVNKPVCVSPGQTCRM